MRFHSWLESEYHLNPHQGLNGKTPLEAWVENANRIIAVDPGIDYIRIFYHEVSRKVHKDSTITLYEVPRSSSDSGFMSATTLICLSRNEHF